MVDVVVAQVCEGLAQRRGPRARQADAEEEHGHGAGCVASVDGRCRCGGAHDGAECCGAGVFCGHFFSLAMKRGKSSGIDPFCFLRVCFFCFLSWAKAGFASLATVRRIENTQPTIAKTGTDFFSFSWWKSGADGNTKR